ncbi:co-chaperone YbbN [Granulicoccus sp. GXG6511]|uniref:co-chaperone YbbN n=1 Tax=Granulicoccus sp. GXG6511 TaxID=3381351 RepID=UPI003D7EEB04
MTSESFSRPGAVDLSSLAQQPPGQGASGSAGPSYVTEMRTPQDFDAMIRLSVKHPVLVEFTSARAQGGTVMSNDLAEVVNGMDGKVLLARVDADVAPELAQALSIQALPTVIALLGGQAAPLFQGVQPKRNLLAVIDQVLQAAVANGIVGKADPVAGPQDGEGEGGAPARPSDPRFDAAYAAMEAGDFATARAEFDKLLKETPNDTEAQVGHAQAGLLARAATLDGSELTRGASEPDNIEAQLAAADFDMVQGNVEGAFERLVAVIRRTAGDDRETARVRLLELFDTVGPTDPAVLTFRRKLASALF